MQVAWIALFAKHFQFILLSLFQIHLPHKPVISLHEKFVSTDNTLVSVSSLSLCYFLLSSSQDSDKSLGSSRESRKGGLTPMWGGFGESDGQRGCHHRIRKEHDLCVRHSIVFSVRSNWRGPKKIGKVRSKFPNECEALDATLLTRVISIGHYRPSSPTSQPFIELFLLPIYWRLSRKNNNWPIKLFLSGFVLTLHLVLSVVVNNTFKTIWRHILCTDFMRLCVFGLPFIWIWGASLVGVSGSRFKARKCL